MRVASGLPPLFGMWRSTRLVVLTSVIAAIHAAVVIPTKLMVILPGVTEVRPGMAMPIVFSLLFGPAAAWGTALGNTIGDLFGTLGPGTLFGFLGNLLYGFIPWRIWEAWRRGRFVAGSWTAWGVFTLCVVAASAACALVIGWGIHALGLFHFQITSTAILLNNVAFGMILGPLFLLALEPRVARMGLRYRDIVPAPDREGSGGRAVRCAASLAVAGLALAGILAGDMATAGDPDGAVTAAALPFLALLLLAAAFL